MNERRDGGCGWKGEEEKGSHVNKEPGKVIDF